MSEAARLEYYFHLQKPLLDLLGDAYPFQPSDRAESGPKQSHDQHHESIALLAQQTLGFQQKQFSWGA
jgi:hypothetical protein